MVFGVPGLNRTWIALAGLMAISVTLVSCGNTYNNPGTSTSTSNKPSGLTVRAFVSNPLQPAGTGVFSPVLNIMDASLDQVSTSFVDLSSSIGDAGLMVLSPNKQTTLVLSPSQNAIAVVDNLREGIASGSSSAISLTGPTRSMVVGSDNATGYAAVATATIANGSPGALEVFSLNTRSVTASIPIPGAQYVVQSHNGNRLLVFGQNSNTVTVIAPSLIGTSSEPRKSVTGFDHPVWGVFSNDDSTAYVLNCGPECGGTAAGVTVLNLNTNTPGATIPLPGSGATMGLLSGSSLYVAGSPPGFGCGSGTAAVTCGTLNIVNLAALSVSNSSPIVITDGYHERMEISANGQLFIGARNCTNVNISGGEVRGCLSIFDTVKSKVVIPPDSGDVTGIQPIANRNVVYLCQGGNFRVYDTTTDKLLVPSPGHSAIQIIGQSMDVKQVD
jgi:hypothetical protein